MTKTYTTDAYIARETAKAVRLDLGDLLVWAPKSIATIESTGVTTAHGEWVIVTLPAWFIRKNDLFDFFAYSKAEVRRSVAEILQRREAAGL